VGELVATKSCPPSPWRRCNFAVFFANLRRGLPPNRCADDDGHNVASMGGFVMLPPVILWSATQSISKGLPAAISAGQSAAVSHLLTTHKSDVLAEHATVYAELLVRTLFEEKSTFRGNVIRAATAIGVDLKRISKAGSDGEVVGGVFSTACYIQDSFPSLLYLAHKYVDDPEACLIANTNLGGENCHRCVHLLSCICFVGRNNTVPTRLCTAQCLLMMIVASKCSGSALGALIGTLHGEGGWPARWMNGLSDREQIDAEAEELANACMRQAPSSSG
jgi:ADP-ribosylglycohydrolase